MNDLEELRSSAQQVHQNRRTIWLPSGTVITVVTGSKHWRGGRRNDQRSLEERFLERVRKTDTCWLWEGSTTKDGYGRFFAGKNAPQVHVAAHRWAYEHWVGPIPDGYVIDHKKEVCGHRNCVNPAHLEPVTNEENIARGWRDKREKRETCARGHRLTKDNLTSDGHCLECRRQYVREYQAKKRNDPEYKAKRAELERNRRQTPEQRAKQAEYRRERREIDNQRRRERYASDPEYRERINAANRTKKAKV